MNIIYYSLGCSICEEVLVSALFVNNSLNMGEKFIFQDVASNDPSNRFLDRTFGERRTPVTIISRPTLGRKLGYKVAKVDDRTLAVSVMENFHNRIFLKNLKEVIR